MTEQISKLKIDKIPNGVIRAPASKSVGHRALICAALAASDYGSPGKSETITRASEKSREKILEKAINRIRNLDTSDDIEATRAALAVLIKNDPENRVIDCAESGSTLRFLIPLAGLGSEEWTFTGRGRLMDRPLDIYKDIFETHGGYFAQSGGKVTVRGPLRPGTYELPGNVSSQFVSGLLFALPLLGSDSEIILTSRLESADYANLTVDVMLAFGVEIDELADTENFTCNFTQPDPDEMLAPGCMEEIPQLSTQLEGEESSTPNNIEKLSNTSIPLAQSIRHDTKELHVSNRTEKYSISQERCATQPPHAPQPLYRIPAPQLYNYTKYTVEGDWSQAAFFLCAGSLGARISVTGLDPGSVQGDMRIIRVLKDMGADVDVSIPMFDKRNCTVTAFAPHAGLRGISLDASDIPDLVPPIAALACYAKGTTRITGASRLRLKESDRIETIVSELAKLGANICTDGDDIIIEGRDFLDGDEADAHGDHRIAMAVAVASVRCVSPVYLTGAESVSKSYPKFWEDFLLEENANMGNDDA
jgi:5-enolpyruvylshikimate-3-phosphate synthase